MTIRSKFRTWWAPPDRRPIWEWAHDSLLLPACLPINGAFVVERSRHFIEPLAALQDERVRQVVVRKPVRGGGTLISDIWHCWTRANDAGPQMVVLHADPDADEHAETRLMPMLRSVQSIQAIMPSDGDKARKTDILFADGNWLKVVGPSISNLQHKAIRYLSLDELWRYKPGTLQEAEARLGDFIRLGNSKLCIISQEGEPGGDVELRAEQGHMAEWAVECQGCHRHIIPLWTGLRSDGSRWGMRWDDVKDERGQWVAEKCLSSIRYECPHCAHPHIRTPGLMSEWNRTGKYIAQRPDAPTRNRSFRWNAIIDFPWEELVTLYLDAMNAFRKGVTEPLVVFWQKRMCQAKDPGNLNDTTIDFNVSAYDVKSKWDKEYIRFMTVDKQMEGVYWVLVAAWSQEGQARRLYYGKAHGRGEVEALANEWNCQNVFVDSGHEAVGNDGVYMMCVENNWVALKGDQKRDFIHIINKEHVRRSYSQIIPADPERGTASAGEVACNLIMFSSDVFNDRLEAMLRSKHIIEPMRDPQDPSEVEYRSQITAEVKRYRDDKITGRPKWFWHQLRKDNHARDCWKMQLVPATIAGLLPDTDITQAPSDSRTAEPDPMPTV